MTEVNAVAAVAMRDLFKFLRDRGRLIATFVFPFLLMGVFGTTLQANLGKTAGFNFVGFVFTGVLGMTLFQSSAQGTASLLEDRQNDFAQEIFVAPISRYSIVLGKILGETLVALSQGIPLVIFAIVLHVSVSPGQVVLMIPVAVMACCLGAAFGLLVMAGINTQQAANQAFNFLLLPQFFLAGVFAPIQTLPLYLSVISHLSPMRYVIDMFRGIVYWGRPEYHNVVLADPLPNLLILVVMFAAFIIPGTALFVRRETNK